VSFEIGDKVQWTHINHRRSSVSMVYREGVIMGFSESGYALVRHRTWKALPIAPARLRSLREPSQIDEMVAGIREVSRGTT
jgi:hypothetical protein